MTVAPPSDPVGVVEVAERAGVTRHAIDKWRARHPGFPSPRWTVGNRPCWEWQDVATWLRDTGRLPDPPTKDEP